MSCNCSNPIVLREKYKGFFAGYKAEEKPKVKTEKKSSKKQEQTIDGAKENNEVPEQ